MTWRSNSNSKLQYWLDGNVLNSTSCEDLGVWISRDLKLTHHITEACEKLTEFWK